MTLTPDERVALQALADGGDVSSAVARRARIVLWRAEGRQKAAVAALAGVSRPTVDVWLRRYAAEGISGLLDRSRPVPRARVSASVRDRIVALSRRGPPVEMGLRYWSSRELARFLAETEGVSVSHHYVATLWRRNGIAPRRDRVKGSTSQPAGRGGVRERNRRALLDAAIELVAVDGYEASLEAITERAGLSTGAVYSQFGSKAKLFAEVVDELTQTFLHTLTPLTDPTLDLESALGRTGQLFYETLVHDMPRAKTLFELEVFTRAFRDDALMRRIKAIHAAQHTHLRQLLLERHTATGAPPITPALADHLATTLPALLRGLVQYALITPHATSAETFATAVAALTPLGGQEM